MENWSKRLEKVEQIICRWSRRNLSISGKLCIIKSFLVSQFVYVMQALLAPVKVLDKLNTILFRFLWKRKYSNTKAFEKVKRNVLCNVVEEGGINMINVHDMQTSFLLTWAAKLQQQKHEPWTTIPLSLYQVLGRNLLCFKATTPLKLFQGIECIRSNF